MEASAMRTCMLLLVLAVVARAQWDHAVLETVTSGPDVDTLGRRALAVDALGGVHLIIDRVVGGTDHNFFHTMKPPGGAWTAPVPVGDHGAVLANPFLAVHETSGTPYLVYLEGGLLKLGVAKGSTWTYYDLQTPYLDALYFPALAVDDSGYAHVAVIESTGGIYKMCYGLWDGAQFHFQIIQSSWLGDYGSGASPDLCVQSDGSAAIAYRGGNYLNYQVDVAQNSALGGTTWNIQTIDVPGHDCYSPAIKALPSDDLHLVLHGKTGFSAPGYVFHTTKAAGAPGWDPVFMVNGSLHGGDVRLAVESNGTAHVTFQEVSGNFYTGNICFATNKSGTWTSAYLLKGDKGDPSLAMDREGNGSLVFEQYMTYPDSDIQYYGFSASPMLNPDVFFISAGSGGTVALDLDAGASAAGRNYLVLGGVTGTKPGHPLPDGLATLPLNWDAFTDIVLGLLNTSVFSNFLGTLDAAGGGAAQIHAPPLPPAAVGVKMFYAYCVNKPFDLVSNPISIEVVP
jgi:hypothetical protein